MRSNGGLDSEFVNSKRWDSGRGYKSVEQSVVDGKKKTIVHSISGHERNKLFMSREGKDVVDMSMISNADSVADSRCFAVWDFDHDGRQDLILVNVNNPHLEIFRNRMDRFESGRNNSLAIRFVGGQSNATPSSKWTNRNGFGAKVEVSIDGQSILREHRCGEGFSAQNSSTLIIGIGAHTVADTVTVTWPSGKIQRAVDVPVQSLVTFFENEKSSVTENGIDIGAYEVARDAKPQEKKDATGLFALKAPLIEESDTEIRVLIAMATWCPNCIKQHAAMRSLVDQSNLAKVGFFGMPIDPNDSEELLSQYSKQQQTPFPILTTLPLEVREQARRLLGQRFGAVIMPATVVTDRNGHVLEVMAGIPTVSSIRRLADKLDVK